MEFSKNDYWAIILGGSRGLGLATAKKLVSHGINVCIVHRDPRTQLPQFILECESMRTSGSKVLTFNMDATKRDSQKEICTQLKKAMGPRGRVRLLLHSIAKGNVKPMASTKVANLDHQDFMVTLDAMAVSLYDWTRQCVDFKLFAKDARVLSFTSEGSKKPWIHYAAVGAAKAALEAITRSIALEFAPFGIKANCIQAGVTDTQSLAMIPNSDAIKKYTQKRNPSNRLTRPEDVANVVYLMCKDESAWINGAILPVDGGEHLS